MQKLCAALLLYLGLASAALAQQITPPTGMGTIVCAYNSSLPTITTAFFGYVQCDSHGQLLSTVANTIPTGNQASPATTAISNIDLPSSSSTAAITHTGTASLANNLSAATVPANLFGYNCTGIAGGSAGYCIAYNGSSTPGTGALTAANVLDFCYFDTSPRGCSLWRYFPVNYNVGIQILISSATSPYTYTTGTDTGAITVDSK